MYVLRLLNGTALESVVVDIDIVLFTCETLILRFVPPAIAAKISPLIISTARPKHSAEGK